MPAVRAAKDEDEEILGRDIDASVEPSRRVSSVGKAVPGAPKLSKVEDVSDDEDEDDLEGALAAAQPSQPRCEVAPGTTAFRENAVHVYGLDFLKTGHMEEIFNQFSHKYIEWINDSSANIIFADAAYAKKALESLSFPKPDDEPWRRTPDILVSEDVSPIFLQLRLATAKDTKKLRKAVPKAMPAAYYSQSQNQNQGVARGAGRRRLYADDPGGSSAPGAVAKAQSKAKAKASNGIALQKRPKVFTEEEIRKRQRRTDRFGPVEVQRVAETPQTGARPVKDVVAALALRVASGQLVHSGPAPVGSGPAVASSGGGQIGAADTTAPAIRAQALTTVRPVVVGVAAPRLATELEKRNKRASRFAKEDAAKGTADVPAAGGQTQESSTVTSTAAVAKAFGRRQRISVENECEEHVPACKAGTKVG